MSWPGPVSATLRHAPHGLAAAVLVGALMALVVPPPALAWVGPAVTIPLFVRATVQGTAARALTWIALTLLVAGWAWGGTRLATTAAPQLAMPGVLTGTVDVETVARIRPGGRTVRVRVVDAVLRGRRVPVGTRLLADVPASGPRIGPGTRLRVAAEVRPAVADGAPEWWAAYVTRSRLAGRLHVTLINIAGRRGGLSGLRDRLRIRAGDAAGRGLTGDAAAVVRGMALGGGHGLSDATSEAFRDAGVWHLLAVSGQNITIVGSALLHLLGAMGIARRRAAGISIGAIVTYCLACDGGASVARAGLIGVLAIVGELRSRGRDRWHLLLAGLVILIVIDPRAIGDPGLQLSFAAVAGMYLVAGPVGAWLAPLAGRKPANLFGQAFGATLATAPVVVWHFGAISLVGLGVNMIAVPLAAPIVVAALVGIVAGALVPVAGIAVNLVAGAGASVLIAVAQVAAAVPGATITLSRASTFAAVGALIGVVWLLRRTGSARPSSRRAGTWRPRVAVAVAVAALLTAGALPRGRAARVAPWPAVAAVTVLDIGQGDAILLRSPDGAAALVDTGPPGTPAPVVEALRRSGVRHLDVLALTHDQADHAGAADAVMALVGVDQIITAAPVADAERSARRRGVPVRRVAAGDRLTVGVWTLAVMSPAPGAPAPEDPNDGSLVVRAQAAGLSALLTGDAESGVLERLPVGVVDVLKVAHHGSADAGAGALIRRIAPRVAIISAGAGNRYGHPAGETLSVLRASGVDVRRTDERGDVTVSAAPGGVALTTSR